MWNPAIKGTIEVSTPVDFTYGFDVVVPDASSIRLAIGNLSNSTSHGFSGSTVTALPLTATDSSISLTLSLAFHSELLLGVDILSGKGSISAGAFLDLPALSVNISEVKSVDKNCNPSQDLAAADTFALLTKIVSNVDIALGLQASVQLSIPDSDFKESVGTTATLAGTASPLSTACLSFDAAKKVFASPTVTTTDASKKKSGAGMQRSSPLARDGGMESLYWTAGLLGCVIFVALGL